MLRARTAVAAVASWVRHFWTGEVWCSTCRTSYRRGSAHSWGVKGWRVYD